MLRHDNFSAWIEIEGVPTQEYNIEVTSDSEGPVVTCWIASEEEKVSAEDRLVYPVVFEPDCTSLNIPEGLY